MKLEFKTLDFKVEDAVFTVNELSKDGFFSYLDMKDAKQRFNFVLDELISINGLEDSSGKPVSPNQLKEIEIPWGFVKAILKGYGDAVFAETAKELTDSKEQNEKNAD
jgi:hypothetical protein